MSGRIYKKHEKRRKLALRYLNKKPFFGYGYSDAYQAWEHILRYSGPTLSRYHLSKLAEYHKQIESLTWWDIQELESKHRLAVASKSMDRSRWNRSGGVKSYKRPYHERRRTEGKRLEHYAMLGDDAGFESISPDGWMGAIAWQIW